MPSIRSTDINNTLASIHGLPYYADNLPLSGLAWDIGATEVGTVAPTASIALSDPSPTVAGNVIVTVTTSVPVVQLPGPLTFLEMDGTSKLIVLSGSIPGAIFTGTLVVDNSVSDGMGTFSLPIGNLVGALGNTGNVISSGAQTLIDETPPRAVTNLHIVN